MEGIEQVVVDDVHRLYGYTALVKIRHEHFLEITRVATWRTATPNTIPNARSHRYPINRIDRINSRSDVWMHFQY